MHRKTPFRIALPAHRQALDRDRLPIVFASEHRIEPADQVAGLLLGADDYFAKPLRADLFLARLRRLLARAAPHEHAGRSALTPRERDLLKLLVEGCRRRRSPIGSA